MMNSTVLIYFVMSFLIPLALMFKGSYECRVVDGHITISYKWSVALIIAFVITVLIKGLPYNTQTDWIYYYEHIKTATAGRWYDWGSHTEPGYRFLINVLAFLRMPRLTFFIVCAFLWYYSIFKFSNLLQKSAPIILILCFPFLFSSSINIFRQYLAMSFLLLSIHSYFKEQYIKTIILFFVAFFFHVVILLFLIIIPIEWLCKKYRINKYWIITFVIINTILGMSVLRPFLDLANSMAASLESMNEHTYNLENLLENEWEQKYVWLKTFVAVITILLSDDFKDKNRIMSFLFYSCSFFYVINPLCQQLELSRIALLWRMFLPFLLGYMVYTYYKKKEIMKLLLLSMIILLEYITFFQKMTSISVEHPYIIKLF